MLGRRLRTVFAKMKIRIICNPGAGSVDDRDPIREKLLVFPNSEVHFTEKEGDATRLAEDAVAKGCSLVIAAGGDGTLNEVINGIAPHADKIQVGLVPLGTGNDFARMLDLPTSIEDCVAVLRAGNVRPIDLVRVTSDRTRYFVNVSAAGLAAR